MKSSRLIFWIISLAVAIVAFYIISESFSQPGLERFEDKIVERGFYRNENNTGPVLRVYAAEVLEANVELMKEYGDAMPHTKYGKTVVFFFKGYSSEPISISSSSPYISSDMQSSIIATYTKTPMGESGIVEKFAP